MKKPLFSRRMFTPKSEKKTRVRGVEKPRITFRVPPELWLYIEGAEAAGYERTEIIIRMLTLAKDVIEELGTDWLEIERRAAVGSIRPGIAIGQAVKEAIAKPKR